MNKVLQLLQTCLPPAAVAALIWNEQKRPLRKPAPTLRHYLKNLTFALPTLAVGKFIMLPSLIQMTRFSRKYKLGLIPRFLPHPVISGMAGILLLDYSFYLWHRMNHRLPFLWRFHEVHHLDDSMDLTTNIRFHFLEVLFSVFFRAPFIIFGGMSATLLMSYETTFQLNTLFHHSNVKLPLRLEKYLSIFLATPRMHWIHHSIRKKERDTNYGVIFMFWDKIHGTKNWSHYQKGVKMGVEERIRPPSVIQEWLVPFKSKKIITTS